MDFQNHMVASIKQEIAEAKARITDTFATDVCELMDGLSLEERKALVEFLKGEPNPTENVKATIAKLEEY